MKMSRRTLACAVAAAAVVVGSAGSARATLLTYEGFNYTAGANALNSKNGGTGYSAGYSSNNNADVVEGSLDYTDGNGRQLITTGNRAFLDSTTVGDPAGASVSIAPNRGVQNALFTGLTGPLYISFVGQQTAGDQRDMTVSLFVKTATDSGAAPGSILSTQERISVGHGNPSASGATDGSVNWGAYADAVGQQGAYSDTPATTKSLVVVRVDLNVSGDNDRFRVYVNPALGTEPAAADAESAAYNFFSNFDEINRIRMRAGGSNPTLNLGATQAQFDEIRVGTTYADVTPMVAAALAGDANYNGTIDPDDFAAIDHGLAMGLGGYSNGDFDANGTINSADYLIIDQSYVNQGGHFSAQMLADREQWFGADYVAAISVPEPASLGLMACGALLVVRRRR